MTRLQTLAHVRTGDKGDTCQFSVIAYRPTDFSVLASYLTCERIGAHFSEIAVAGIRRFEMPQLGALIFVMDGALRSGVTRSLSLDAHGKCLGGTLLDLDVPDRLLGARPAPALTTPSGQIIG
jgi:hypothetical protein